MPKIGGVLVVPRSHGTRSERSHRSPDMSFSSVIAMLHDASHRYSLVTVVFAPMRGGYPPARSASKRENTRPAPPLHRPFREKVRPASTKTPNLGCFKRAGRTFRARTHTRPSRATNFARSTQKYGDLETSNTTARPQQGTTETDSTIACLQHPENRHFPRAKATPVSSQRSHKVAKVSPVSSRRSSALDTAPMQQIAQQHTGN